MENYWETRYKSGGNSGSGSYGEYAEYKAATINELIAKYDIKTISDFGCGDGNQIGLFSGYDTYHGYDISEFIIGKNIVNFKNNYNMSFYYNIKDVPESDMCLSLDVTYHIVNENDFINYISELFGKSKKYVLIYSSDFDGSEFISDYVHHRKIGEWISKLQPDFELIETPTHPTIATKFFMYERKVTI